MTVAGWALVALGIVYIIRPDIFRRGIWLKTSIAVRAMSDDGYRRYMRALGLLFIMLGATLIALAR